MAIIEGWIPADITDEYLRLWRELGSGRIWLGTGTSISCGDEGYYEAVIHLVKVDSQDPVLGSVYLELLFRGVILAKIKVDDLTREGLLKIIRPDI